MSIRDWAVGDDVVLTDVNAKGHRTAKVTKVGRRYVFAGGNRYDPVTRRTADAYGHGAIWKTEDFRAHLIGQDLGRTLQATGRYGLHITSVQGLRDIITTIEAALLVARNAIGESK